MPRIPIRAAYEAPRWRSRGPKIARLVPPITVEPKLRELLETPTWSVSELLPPSISHSAMHTNDEHLTDAQRKEREASAEISREKLHHLLRLSALPPPKDKAEEDSLLNTLAAQIHFVKEIQKVDTTGVEPLVAIRDETDEAIREQTVTAHKLDQFFAQEEEVGPNGTIRRRKDVQMVVTDDKESSPNRFKPVQRLNAPFELGRNETNRRIGNFFYVKKAKKDIPGG